MKCYNPKNTVYGIVLLLLGILNFLFSSPGGRNWNDWVLILACLFWGGGILYRSFSQKYAAEDKLEEQDERNRLVLLKNKSRAFQLVEWGSLVLATLLIILGKQNDEMSLIYAGLGVSSAFFLCLFADLATFLYYDHKI